MKLFKIIVLAAAAVLLCASCTKSGTEQVLGNYSVTCDKAVSSSTGSGVIYYAMYNKIVAVARDFNFRTDANDKAVIAAADQIASEYKDQASEKITVSVIFTEANALGEAEKKPVVIKSYTFTPVQ